MGQSLHDLQEEYRGYKEQAVTNFKSLNIVGVCMTGQVQKNIARMDIL